MEGRPNNLTANIASEEQTIHLAKQLFEPGTMGDSCYLYRFREAIMIMCQAVATGVEAYGYRLHMLH